MWYWHDGPDGWGVFWMGLMMAIVWLPLLVLLIWAFRQFTAPPRRDEPPAGAPTQESDAREEARRAYARGELDRERFLQVIEDLDRTKG